MMHSTNNRIRTPLTLAVAAAFAGMAFVQWGSISAVASPGVIRSDRTVGAVEIAERGRSIPLKATAGECEPHWDNTLGQPGLNSTVVALTVRNGELIAGGGTNISRWDGSE